MGDVHDVKLREIKEKLDAVNARLDALKAQGVSRRPDDVNNDLVYIDRALGNAPKSVQRIMEAEVDQLRARMAGFKKKGVGFALEGLDATADEQESSGDIAQRLKSQRSQGSFPARQYSVKMRDWGEEDSEADQRAYIELGNQASELQQMAADVAVHIEDDQNDFDRVTSEAHRTTEVVDESLATTLVAAETQRRGWRWMAIAAAVLAILLITLLFWLSR